MAFITFETGESAISAYAECDQKYFQGRKLHIKPAEKKPYVAPREYEDRPYEFNHDGDRQPYDSNYKKQKELILKTNFDDETNWNYLFMNQDTVATSMAKQLGQNKGDFMNVMQEGQGESLAVKMASAETLII